MGDKAILMVDDDEAILRACQRGIGRRARLFTAATPDQARKVVRTEHLDAIVVDYRLVDRETGVDLLHEFRDRVPEAKILLWSACTSNDITAAAMKAGADDVRSMPVTLQALQRGSTRGRGRSTTIKPQQRSSSASSGSTCAGSWEIAGAMSARPPADSGSSA